MTARKWKPGDVALVRISSDYRPEVAVSGDRQWFVAGPRLGSQHGWPHGRVEVIRPLVVLDPEDPKHVEQLADAILRLDRHEGRPCYSNSCHVTLLADALRAIAAPPTEPFDPKAAVTDYRENIWRLLADGDWVCTSGPDVGEYLDWTRLAAERGPLSIEGESA